MCSHSRRLVPLFVRGRFHRGDYEESQLKPARSFNFTFRFLDDVFSLKNCKFDDFVDLIELEIKYTTYTASYLDLHPESDSENRIRTKLYDIRDDFNFPIVNIFYLYAATFQQHPNMDYISFT